VTFVDTSAIYALADLAEVHHSRAQRLFAELLQNREALLTHNYVLLESFALLQAQSGLRPPNCLPYRARILRSGGWDSELHETAVAELTRNRVSLVDQVSFILMRALGVRRAFAFDDDFRRAGFELIG